MRSDELMRVRQSRSLEPMQCVNSTADRNINPTPHFGIAESSSSALIRGELRIITGTPQFGKCFNHSALATIPGDASQPWVWGRKASVLSDTMKARCAVGRAADAAPHAESRSAKSAVPRILVIVHVIEKERLTDDVIADRQRREASASAG